MVVFDATMLLLLLSPDAPSPRDASGNRIEGARQRVDLLIEQLENARTKIVIPTPALSEILVRAGEAGPAYLAKLSSSSAFRIVPFDTRAAVELAQMTRAALDTGRKRAPVEEDRPWAKVKFDRQIVAIAKVEGASAVYSDDDDVKKIAIQAGMTAFGVADLPLRPALPQLSMDLP
jgi:predicted nucleic acid-binding protein